ncbi:MAG: STY0301 family protein [Bdellovibrionota bacterium]
MKFFIFFAFFLSNGSLFAADFRCPDSIATNESVTSKVPSEWRSLRDEINGSQSLENVEVYDGPFEDGASLVPDNVAAKDAPYWNFEKGTSQTHGMACLYSQSAVRLVRSLPARIKRCTMTFSKVDKTRPQGLSCR